jgi:hypothetical protein
MDGKMLKRKKKGGERCLTRVIAQDYTTMSDF